jgi:subtilisin family serine protease
VIRPEKFGISDHYIVVYKQNVSSVQREHLISRLHLDNIQYFKIGTFSGFSAKLPEQALSVLEKADDVIDYIEQDQTMFVAGAACTEEDNAPWGLSRIVHRTANDGFESNVYRYSNAGQGVVAFIIDTGIEITHPEFEGRARWGANYADTTNTDCNGHGTHVAGTVGSATYGVAKQVELVAVKVLDCSGSGSNSGVIQGIQYATDECNRLNKKNKCVSNMSLGGGVSSALDQAVEASVAEGVAHVVAAGNSNTDACFSSPARVSAAVTVAASYYDFHTTVSAQDVNTYAINGEYVDIRAYFSNFGRCVDIVAPGQQIESTWIKGGVATISGTSMASPHVAGVSVLALSSGIVTNVADLKATLQNLAVPNVLTLNCPSGTLLNRCEQTPNLLLQSTSCVQQ